jgi:hypothetical protein
VRESLAAANRGNDLDFIPIGEDGRRMLAPGDDFPVALDGDALAFEGKIADEIGNPLRGHPTNVRGTVYRNRSHRFDRGSGRLLSVVAHHNAQEAYLPLELFARLAEDQMQLHEQALAKRHTPFLDLRDQAARVLA